MVNTMEMIKITDSKKERQVIAIKAVAKAWFKKEDLPDPFVLIDVMFDSFNNIYPALDKF